MHKLLQLTLDFFGEAPRPAPVAGPRVPSGGDVAPLQGGAAPSAPALPGVAFVHPRATREIVLGDARVAYEFERSRRRTIGFSVGPQGLSVRAPRWVALREVDQALREKSDWILRKLVELRQREARQEAGRIVWREGAQLPFLGRPLTLRLDPSQRQSGLRGHPVGAAAETAAIDPIDAPDAPDAPDADAPDPSDAPQTLWLALSPGAEAARLRDAAQAWLTRQARCLFTERLNHYAPLLGVRWTRLSLSNAATRWGSASADGSIRLNWRLIHYRLPIIDYVVVHELAHLRVMDHSPRFWDEVERVLPDYAARRQVLKDEPAPRWE